MNKEEIYELRAEWLSKYSRTEDDVLFDEEKNCEYINVEKTSWAEIDGRDIDYEDGFRKEFLPDNLQL